MRVFLASEVVHFSRARAPVESGPGLLDNSFSSVRGKRLSPTDRLVKTPPSPEISAGPVFADAAETGFRVPRTRRPAPGEPERDAAGPGSPA